MELIPGGKGANQVFVAGKLGPKICMIGVVGDDDNGQILINNLKSTCVDTSGIYCVNNQSTGAAFIKVNQKGKTVILDPAPTPEFLPDELLQNVDIIKPNQSELETLTQTSLDSMYNMKDFQNASKILIDRGAKVVIVTLGKRGAVLVSKDIFLHSPTIESVKVMDTTAGGDCFTAAFASSFIKNNSYEQAIKYANAASSVAVTRKGAQSSMPTAEEVSEMVSGLR